MMSKYGNVCIAGKNRIAIDALQIIRRYFRDDQIFAVCNATDNGIDEWQPSYRKFVDEENIVVIDLAATEEFDDMLLISVEYDKIIKTERYAKTCMLINMHFSALPAYKGVYTSALPILHGETYSGCTLHEMDAGIDTGSMVSQLRFDLGSDETAKTLYTKYLENGSALIAREIESILNGDYEPIEQASAGSTYFSKRSIDYANLTIDLRVTAEQLRRQVRAYNHRSFQLPSIHGETISNCEITKRKSVRRPGEVIDRGQYWTDVATIDYDCRLIHDCFDLAEKAALENNALMLDEYIDADPGILRETSKRGWSLMAVAAFNGSVEALRVLIDRGADIDLGNGKGTTPVMYAKSRFEMIGDSRPLAMVIAAGADTTRRDFRGKTVFDYLSDDKRDSFYAIVSDNRPR